MKKSRTNAVIVAIILILLAAIAVLGLLIYKSRTQTPALPDGYSPIIDSINCDVDGDWFGETCILSYGPTSGLFTFTLTVQEFNGVYYRSTFCTEVYHLSFVENEDGTVQVRGETQGEDPVVHYFDISIEDGIVLLSENGELLPCWGS